MTLSLAIAAFAVGCATPVGQPQTSPSAVPAGSGTAAAASPFEELLDALPSPAPNFQPPSDDAWAEELETIGDDGRLPLEAALRMLSTAVPELATSGATAPTSTARSGSVAIRTVAANWDRLSPEQQVAIQAALGPLESGSVLDAPPLVEGPEPGRAMAIVPGAYASIPYSPELLDAIQSASDGIAQTIANKMGWSVPENIKADVAPCETHLGCAMSLWQSPSGPSFVGSGAYAGCRIIITGKAIAGGAAWAYNTLAHEVFHCFQAKGYGSLARAGIAPAWIIEGGAEWVANDIMGDAAPTDPMMVDWFSTPGTSLMKRKYDAAGFWAHLAETGTDPYAVFPAVFGTNDGPSAFVASGAAANEHFLDSWASSITLKEEFGRDWEMVAPGLPGFKAGPEMWEVANESSVEIHAEPYTARLFYLVVSADMLGISGIGHARISDGSIDTTAFPTKFCVNASGCEVEEAPGKCPDPQSEIPPAPLGSKPWFVLTGGVTGATYTVSGMKVPEAPPCRTSPPTPEPTEDEFCKRYVSMLQWAQQYEGTDFEVSQPWAAEIARRSREMRPFAPPQLIDDVDLYINVYGTYATAPEPANVPIVGPAAAFIATAFMAMNQYCGINF